MNGSVQEEDKPINMYERRGWISCKQHQRILTDSNRKGEVDRKYESMFKVGQHLRQNPTSSSRGEHIFSRGKDFCTRVISLSSNVMLSAVVRAAAGSVDG